MKLTKGIFIDSENETISVIYLDESKDQQYKLIQEVVGGYMEYVPIRTLGNNDLIVNEEGKFKFDKGFRIKGFHEKLNGNGLILGMEIDEDGEETGENVDTTLSIEDVYGMVQFCKVPMWV